MLSSRRRVARSEGTGSDDPPSPSAYLLLTCPQRCKGVVAGAPLPTLPTVPCHHHQIMYRSGSIRHAIVPFRRCVGLLFAYFRSQSSHVDPGRDRGTTLVPLDLTTMSVSSYGTDGDALSTRRTRVRACSAVSLPRNHECPEFSGYTRGCTHAVRCVCCNRCCWHSFFLRCIPHAV